MSGALDPVIQQEIIDRDLYSTAVLSGNRNFDGRIHPYAKQAFLASPPWSWRTLLPERSALISNAMFWG
ncbi:aconitase family protein [Bordetella holmesii 30539]|nr:aconitase family protein [Bordetella holmesii 30539]